MRPETIQRLNELNQRFYGGWARSFSDTRQRPWPGWAHVVEALRASGPRPLSVLELGCGNGRFGAYLLERWRSPIRYVGLDQSAELLAQARERLAAWPSASLDQVDVIGWKPGSHDRFDLVAAIGLMHHLPGFATRAQLLGRAKQALAPEGLLVMTFWQFAHLRRFQRKLVPWRQQHRYVERAVDETDLEPGDHLLSWGHGEATVRYCHHASNTEVARLLDAAELRLCHRFRADGADGGLNLYVIAAG